MCVRVYLCFCLSTTNKVNLLGGGGGGGRKEIEIQIKRSRGNNVLNNLLTCDTEPAKN